MMNNDKSLVYDYSATILYVTFLKIPFYRKHDNRKIF